MPNLINEIVVRQLSEEFSRAEGLVIVSLAGLTVEESETLRDSLAERGLRLRMVRNRLARLALRTRGIEPPEDMLLGNIACAWGSSEDAINAAKVVQASPSRKGGKIAIKGGIFEGELLGPREAAALADLPGKTELRARMLGVLSAPARNLATLIAAPGSSLARVLQARSEQGAAPAPAG
jgi:large subunit ribosomal protein L10